MAARAQEVMKKYLSGGYNCSQSIISGYCDLFGLDEKTAFKLSEGFGMGMGGFLDECGAVTGTFMVLGLANSDGLLEKGTTKHDTYRKVKEMGEAFQSHFDTMMCGELMAKEKALKAAASAQELEEARGKKLICVECVRWAAQYLDQALGLRDEK